MVESREFREESSELDPLKKKISIGPIAKTLYLSQLTRTKVGE